MFLLPVKFSGIDNIVDRIGLDKFAVRRWRAVFHPILQILESALGIGLHGGLQVGDIRVYRYRDLAPQPPSAWESTWPAWAMM